MVVEVAPHFNVTCLTMDPMVPMATLAPRGGVEVEAVGGVETGGGGAPRTMAVVVVDHPPH